MKSSFSLNDITCVDVEFMKGSEGLKSSFCAAGPSCVDVRFQQDVAVVTDTKNAKALPLIFTREEWIAFVKGVKNDEFDFPE